MPQDLHSETRECQVWCTPFSTRFPFTRKSDVVDTLFHRSTFRNITVECQEGWITIFQKIYFRNKIMSGTRSTSRNTRMSGMMDTIFYYRSSFRNMRLSGMWTVWTRLSTRSTFRNKRMSGKVDWSFFATRSSVRNVIQSEVTTQPYTEQRRVALLLN